jgi:hypothetical protein
MPQGPQGFGYEPASFLSRLAFYFDQVSQVARAHASISLFRGAKTVLLPATNYD